MNLKNVDYIITAKHYGGSGRGYIRKQQADKYKFSGMTVTIRGLDDAPTGTPVDALIWQGQWIAHCECGSASFVDPDEPIFFCFGCGNRLNDSHPRPVRFPPAEERKEIERLILERPVNDVAGLDDRERAGMAKPILVVERTVTENEQSRVMTLPLVRSWLPGQSAEELRKEQDEPIRKWRKELKHGVR